MNIVEYIKSFRIANYALVNNKVILIKKWMLSANIDFKPIEMTDQWFIDLGFKDLGDSYELNGVVIYKDRIGKSDLLKYVHNYQNHYEKFTGMYLLKK